MQGGKYIAVKVNSKIYWSGKGGGPAVALIRRQGRTGNRQIPILEDQLSDVLCLSLPELNTIILAKILHFNRHKKASVIKSAQGFS
jgi:hypothetical protein